MRPTCPILLLVLLAVILAAFHLKQALAQLPPEPPP
jgi:hypothetical protein